MAARSDSTGAPADPIIIVVKRQFDAPAERVFDAWLDRESIARWLFATPGGEMKRVEVDGRVGGEFVVFEQRGEVLAEHYGRYLELDRPRRIEFLFAVSPLTESNSDASRVTIEITPLGAGCEVTLTHEIDPKWADYVDRTRGGWTKMLDKLHNMLESKGTTMSAEPLVVERVLDAPVEAVWRAITNKEGFKHWYFDVDDFKPEVGFEFHFAGEDKGVTFMHDCRVMEVVPPKKLAYSWRYQGFKGDSLVTWELVPEGNGTRVKLTHAGLESFPDHPSFVRTNFEMGWTQIVGTLLKSFLEKQQDGSAGREIISTRLLSFPRDLVFRAFSDPAQLAKWWGPDGFTNTIGKFDFRPGGEWHLTMHGPNGVDYENESEFVEVTPPSRVVYIHLRPMHRFEMAMDFAAEGEQTRLTWRMVFDTDAECERVREFVVPANEQNFDRLAAHLKSLA